MRFPIWILNSSLLTILIFSIATSILLRKEIPTLVIKQIAIPTSIITKESIAALSEKILKNDPFETYIEIMKTAQEKPLITSIPEMRIDSVRPPAPPAKPELTVPLTINLRGIMFSSTEENSLALVEDETGKEQSFAVGENIKDAQIVRIEPNHIVLLRANGQQETLYVRKDERGLSFKDRIESIVKQLSDLDYEIEIENFAKEVQSVGELISQLALISTNRGGKTIGLRVGTLIPNSIGALLGLREGDTITKFNNIGLADVESRMEAIKTAQNLKAGNNIVLSLNRNGMDQNLNYKLVRFKPELFTPFGPPPLPGKQPDPEMFKLGQEQQRTFNRDMFNMNHPVSTMQQAQQDNAIAEIRQRILENLKQRTQ